MASTKRKILIVVEWFCPGYKAGGPIRSIDGFVYALGEDFELSIITRDRDLHTATPYPDIPSNQWVAYGNARVCYVRPEGQVAFLTEFLRDEYFDSLYLNSFFSKHYSLKIYLLYRLGRIHAKQVVIAPRGEFTSERLAEKPWQKKIILTGVRATGYYQPAIWHATSDLEVESVKEQIGEAARVFNTPNLVAIKNPPASPRPKVKGQLKVVFLSRIVNYKNLLGVLQTFQELHLRSDQEIVFDIFGPIQDKNYWEKCREIIDVLPAEIKVNYAGLIPHEEVLRRMGAYHLFFFPTWGENFGHVILEALLAGTPVLISDQTPWRDLTAAGVGWDLPVSDLAAYVAALREALNWSDSEFKLKSQQVSAYAHQHVNTTASLEVYRQLFGGA